jgi:hypothetical protein
VPRAGPVEGLCDNLSHGRGTPGPLSGRSVFVRRPLARAAPLHVVLVGLVPAGCLAWYAPDLARSDAVHASVRPDSPNGDCLECHRPVDEAGHPVTTAEGLAGEPPSGHDSMHPHGTAHAHHGTAHAHHGTAHTASALPKNPAGPWFPAWMLEEETPCVGCHVVR